MLINILIGLLVIAIIAHIIVHILIRRRYNKQNENWNFEKEAMSISRGEQKAIENYKSSKTETEIILPKYTQKKTTENDFLNYGKVIANEQKIKLLTFRIETLEKTLAQLIKRGDFNNNTDFEKIDFKIKVLEDEIENLKNPRKQTNTFFGKKNDPLEKEIRALAFNSKRK